MHEPGRRTVMGRSFDGEGEDLWSIMSRMSKPGDAVYPSASKELNVLLNAKYKVFLEQCDGQQRWRKDIDKAIADWE